MRKRFVIAAVALLAVGSANASPMLVDPTSAGSSVNARITSSNCIGCFVDASLSGSLDGVSAYLDPGESFTFDFFRIKVGGLIGSADVTVDARLAFESLGATGAATGFGGFASFLYVINGGHLSWSSQPASVDLGDGTFLGISFENLYEFGIGNSATVSARAHRYAGAASVPEPGTAALLVVGMLALWLALRQRPVARRDFGPTAV